MSGHNKWSSIKHKKAAVDAKKGKVFSRFSKELMLASKLGGKDPDANPRLRSAISAAKNANMPNDNIDRAIKKGAGELGGQMLEELNYEGYAAGGVAIIVDCLSDNRNRTAADIRNIFAKANGNLANSGAVSWMFHRKSRFILHDETLDEDSLMEMCFDEGIDVEDITKVENQLELIGPAEIFDQLVTLFESQNIIPEESGIVRIPENEVEVEDRSIAKQVLRLLDNLEDYDDTQDVYANANISDAILEELASE